MKIGRKNPTPKNNEFVVLLHGIMRSKTDMLPMKHYLEKPGYDTLNILYPSRKKNLEDLTNFVEEKIRNAKNYSEKILNYPPVHRSG